MPLDSQLIEMDRGEFMIRASEAYDELLNSVQRECASGKIVLTLKIRPGEAGPDPVRLEFEANFKVTKPERKPKVNYYFRDHNGAVTRNDPRQEELDGFQAVGIRGQRKEVK